MFKKTALVVALGSALGLASGAASAASISSLFFPGEINQVSDNSAEYWIDTDQNMVLSVGDRLRGTFDFQTIEDLSGGGGSNTIGNGSSNNGLEGIFDVTVTAAGNFRPGPGGVQVGDFSFGPNPAFANNAPGVGVGQVLPVGSMVAIFEDSTPDYDRTGTIAAAEALVLDGSPLAWVWGFAGDADELWDAFGAPTNPSVFTTIPAGTALGAFQFQLSTLFENFSVNFGQVPCFAQPGGDGLCDINASGSVLGTAGVYQGPGYYEVFDNIDATVFVVPEPGVLALLGVGLLGIGATRLRRRG